MEDWRTDAERRKLKYSEKNTSQCHSVCYKCHVDWSGWNTVLHGDRLTTNHLSNGTAMVE